MRKKQVLILDDEPQVRQLIRRAVEGSASKIVECSDVASATSALQVAMPDLVFLDLQLGNSDAIEAFRAFAEVGYQGAVQLMSGRGSAVLDGVRTVGSRYGFTLLPPLSKPFRLQQIRDALAQVALTDAVVDEFASPVDATARPSFSLGEALDRRWLELWYQPKVDLRTGQTVGAEGLIRGRHPDHGIVAPSTFLGSASDQALAQLTELVIKEALRDWQVFYDAGHLLELCVNAPASALLSLPIAQIIRAHRPRSPKWPGLVLELTEDQIINSLPLAQEIAAQLRIYDVGLSLDDFGQGYSSVARLRDLPFESLKIDRSFVTDCAVDPVKKDLCSSIVKMAHSFGCAVVAEGIETTAELQTLQDLGCEYGQGYLLGRPMARDVLIERLSVSVFQPHDRSAVCAVGEPNRSLCCVGR